MLNILIFKVNEVTVFRKKQVLQLLYRWYAKEEVNKSNGRKRNQQNQYLIRFMNQLTEIEDGALLVLEFYSRFNYQLAPRIRTHVILIRSKVL